MTDKEYMQIAIDISKKSKYPYGAIVVKDNKIIGRSDSEKVKIDTCYTHAEFIAIQDALKENNLYGELKGATCMWVVSLALCVWVLFFMKNLINLFMVQS